GRAHALEIFRTLDVPNVYVGDNWWFAQNGYVPQVMRTRSGPLQVAFVPWPQVSRLLAADEAVAAMPLDQQMKAVEDKLAALIRAQTEALEPGLPAILTCHVSVNDFLVRENQGSEQWMTIGSSPTVLKSSLCEQNFDYIALGHHHNNLDLQMNTPCWYSGSMQRVDFGEEGQDKGFLTFDLDTAKPLGARLAGTGAPRLQTVAARPFLTIEVRPADDDPTPEVCAAIDRKEVADAIVRVEVRLSASQARQFRMPEARRALESAHYVAGIRTVLPDDVRSRLPAGVQPDAASPIESLDLYLRSQDLDDQRRERLRRVAEELLVSVGASRG
ncbi:MAG: exonuclease SbcCD subunit D, partial [Dehalococcoidia bacterium]